MPGRVRKAFRVTQFIYCIYTPKPNVYKQFRPPGLSFFLSRPTYSRVNMDIVYIGAIVLFVVLTCAFAAGCNKLGGQP